MSIYGNPVMLGGSGGGSTNVLSGTTAPTSAQGNNGAVYLKYGIPIEYTPVEYLEVTTAGPYIDTGVVQNPTAYFELSGYWTSTPGNNNALFGCGHGGGNEYLIQTWNGAYICAGNVHVSIGDPYELHNYKADSGGIYIDESLVSSSVVWSNLSLRYFLFAMNWDGTAYKASNARISGCKIYDGTSLIREFVPCTRVSDGEPGMYDIVNNVFYDNDGTGSFTAGPAVQGTSLVNHAYAKVNGAWQDLIGTDINDIDLGS